MMFNTGDLILDAVILSIVARTPEGTYGYKITQDVRSKMDVPESTFYPLLKQMQMDGYLEVYHKDLGGRSRRFYKITESGKERLEFCQQNWTNYLQSASNLLMSAPTQQETAPTPQPVMVEAPVAEPVVPMEQPTMAEVTVEAVVPTEQPVMVEAPVPQPAMMETPAEPEFHIASSSNTMSDMEFSIGGDEVVTEGNNLLSDEVDLFELDSTSSKGAISIEEPEVQPAMVEAPIEPVAPAPQPAMVEAPVEPVAPAPQPAMVEAPVEPVAPAPQPAMVEVPVEPVAPAPQPAMVEAPVEPVAPAPQPAMVEAPVEPVAPAPQPAMVETPVIEEMDDEADFLAEMALGDAEEIEAETEPEAPETLADNMSELESLISQLRSFETKMNAHREYTENNNSEATNNINITDVNAVAALLTPSSQNEENVNQESTVSTRYAEVRNPDTDDSVNSLVDLLKDDQPTKKAGFFKSKVAQASNSIKSMVSDTANAAIEAAKAPSQETSGEEPVAEKKPKKVNFVKYEEVRNPDTDDSVNSLVDLLKDDQPTQKARFFRPRAAKDVAPAPQPEKTEAVAPAEVQNTHKVKFTEVRSPETDDAVNSLVDLLKDDGTSSKPKLFKAWGNKSASTTVAEVKPVEKAENTTPVEMKEVRSPETDDAVNSLVDLLKDDNTSSKPKLFRSRTQKASAPEKVETPVATAPAKDVPVTPAQPVREVAESSNSVDSLVDLLKSDSAEQKPVSIFGKASAKSYTKVSAPAPAPAETPVEAVAEPVVSATVNSTSVQDTEIPSPVVSEPRVFAPKVSSVTNKPTAAKSFEAKAASPNARPVETTATITKPLEAKAISTNPTVAKSAEAKSVETKAVVTPKAETAKPDTAPAAEETAKEEIPMDSFKYRLMQANLLPDEK